jgi:hypothetical protein
VRSLIHKAPEDLGGQYLQEQFEELKAKEAAIWNNMKSLGCMRKGSCQIEAATRPVMLEIIDMNADRVIRVQPRLNRLNIRSKQFNSNYLFYVDVKL